MNGFEEAVKQADNREPDDDTCPMDNECTVTNCKNCPYDDPGEAAAEAEAGALADLADLNNGN